MAHLLCLETTNPSSTRLLFPTPSYTSITMPCHTTTLAKHLLLVLPDSMTLLALLTLRMSLVNTGNIRLFGKRPALSCSGEVTPRQLPLREFLSPYKLIEGSESRTISLMFHHESRTAAHPQQRLLLALVLPGLRSGSVPFGVGLYDLWYQLHFGSFSPTCRLCTKAYMAWRLYRGSHLCC